MRRLAVLGAMSLALLAWGCEAGPEDSQPPRTDYYSTTVQPIFRKNCYRCHGGMNHRGGLSLATRAGVLKGGDKGRVVIPGDPANSTLVESIRHEGQDKNPKVKPMPSKGRKLSDADIAIVEGWVKAGAIMPEDVPKP